MRLIKRLMLIDVDDNTTPEDIETLVHNIENVLHESRIKGELTSNLNDSESGLHAITVERMPS